MPLLCVTGADDEVIEITPKSVRLRKRILDTNARKANRSRNKTMNKE